MSDKVEQTTETPEAPVDQNDQAAAVQPEVASEQACLVNEAEAKAADYWARLLRVQAEMENLQKRTTRDVENAHKYAVEKFVKELLPVVDSLERALAAPLNDSTKALHEGIELTYKMFLKSLEKFQIVQLDPEGQPFNADLHQAISMQQNPKVEANTVLSVMQKGYTLCGRLVRPALVVVSQ